MASEKIILLTGVTGMLGREVYSLIKNLYNKVYTVSRSCFPENHLHIRIDLTHESELKRVLSVVQPEVVIHCAALVNVDNCEKDKSYTYALHVNSTECLVNFSSVLQNIYISTDSLFDGQHGNYTETDLTNPLNYYAYTKQKAEEVVIKFSKKNFIILRTNLVGFHIPLNDSLFEWAYKSLKNENRINGFSNVYFNPLYCGFIARIVGNLLNTSYVSGVYHIGTKDSLSKYDFLISIANRFGFNANLITPKELITNDLCAKRPLNTVLNVNKFRSDNTELPSVGENLTCLFNSFEKYLL